MSLTYSKIKSGPNIDPWEMPQVRFPESENFLSILTLKVFPDKYDSNHEKEENDEEDLKYIMDIK